MSGHVTPELIAERKANRDMWRRLRDRRKPWTPGWMRAQANLYAADMLLEFSYRRSGER